MCVCKKQGSTRRTRTTTTSQPQLRSQSLNKIHKKSKKNWRCFFVGWAAGAIRPPRTASLHGRRSCSVAPAVKPFNLNYLTRRKKTPAKEENQQREKTKWRNRCRRRKRRRRRRKKQEEEGKRRRKESSGKRQRQIQKRERKREREKENRRIQKQKKDKHHNTQDVTV